jgi:hypothetical protein
MRTSLEEGIKLHSFAGIFPEQSLTVAGRHREAVMAADQRMVIRCFGDDLAGFVHDVSHVPPPIQRAGLVDAPIDLALVPIRTMFLDKPLNVELVATPRRRRQLLFFRL